MGISVLGATIHVIAYGNYVLDTVIESVANSIVKVHHVVLEEKVEMGWDNASDRDTLLWARD